MTTLLILLVLALIWIGLRDTRRPRVASFTDLPGTRDRATGPRG